MGNVFNKKGTNYGRCPYLNPEIAYQLLNFRYEQIFLSLAYYLNIPMSYHCTTYHRNQTSSPEYGLKLKLQITN